MHYREYPCHLRLAPLVDCFWAVDNRSGCSQDKLKRVVPDGCIDIIFSLQDTPRTLQAELRLVGPMTVPLLFSMQGWLSTLGVRFRPGGAHALLGIPARELQDQRPLLQEAEVRSAQETLQKMALAEGTAARLAVLQQLILDRLEEAASPDPALAAIIRGIQASDEAQPVEPLAVRYGFGPRRLRRAFDRWVGLSPKQFGRVMRFQKLLARVHSGGAGNWAEQALECGYYDQPHMNRDFKEFAGTTPGDYFTTPLQVPNPET